MAGEAEAGQTGKHVGNTAVPASPDGQTSTPSSSPAVSPASAPLTEPLTPQSALARLKARRELASTGEGQPGTPATPAGPGKSVEEPSVETTDPQDEVAGLLSGAIEDSTGSVGEEPSGADDQDPVVFDHEGKPVRRSEAQQGYIRHQDFTVKTQGLAEVRKNFESATQQATEERTRYGTLLGEQLSALKANEPKRPDLALKASDPMGYNEALVEYLSHQEEVRQRETQIAQLVAEQREADRKLFEVRKAEEQAKMLEAVPSLRNAKTDDQRGKLLGRFKQTALDAGFAEHELSRMIDHRVIRVLEWATIGRAVQKGTIKGHQTQSATGRGGSKPNGSTPAAPPVLPTQSLKATGGGGDPGIKTKPTRDVAEAESRFEKQPSLRDGLALMKARRAARQAQQ